MMTRRGLGAIFAAGWLVLLVLRLTVNYAGAAPSTTLWQVARVVVPITAAWIPLIALVLWVNRSVSSPRTRIAMHVALAVAVAFVEPLFARTILVSAGMVRYYALLFVARLDTNLLLYLIIVVGDVALLRFKEFRARQVAAARLEEALVDTQLHALAIQLQPHFLFNALQFVAETAHEDLRAARRTLGLLRGLVQQAFELETRVEVSVAEEISFLRAYGDIQRSRFGDRFRLDIDADEPALTAGVPPLLLQPLVENAARHGFAQRGRGGHVRVRIGVDGGALSIVVADDGVGPPPDSREGQGLSVTRRRLERLHGSDSSLDLIRRPDEWTEVRIALPFRAAPQRTSFRPGAAGTLALNEAEAALPDSPHSTMPLALRVGLTWLAIIVIAAGAMALGGEFAPVPVPLAQRLTSLLHDVIVALPFWLLMTVAGVWVARRLGGVRGFALHAAIGVAGALGHMFLGDNVARALLGYAKQSFAYQQWGVWDVVVYAIVVCVARGDVVRGWLADKIREQQRLSAQIVDATERLARLRQMQAILLASLDEVIASPTMESLDRAVVEFAEFLRGEVMPDAMGTVAGAIQ